jgi:hypothetical protein
MISTTPMAQLNVKLLSDISRNYSRAQSARPQPSDLDNYSKLPVGGTMKFINGWVSKTKQCDKVTVVFRVAFLTVFELKLDMGEGKFRVMVMNLGFEL